MFVSQYLPVLWFVDPTQFQEAQMQELDRQEAAARADLDWLRHQQRVVTWAARWGHMLVPLRANVRRLLACHTRTHTPRYQPTHTPGQAHTRTDTLTFPHTYRASATLLPACCPHVSWEQRIPRSPAASAPIPRRELHLWGRPCQSRHAAVPWR